MKQLNDIPTQFFKFPAQMTIQMEVNPVFLLHTQYTREKSIGGNFPKDAKSKFISQSAIS